jgi:ribose 5-phosphate isomerase A
MNQDAAKQAAGRRAAGLVESGMRLGLGTGSTTAYALEAIGRRVREEGLDVRGVPTSFSAERLARTAGIPLATFDDLANDPANEQANEQAPMLDLALDGADEVSPDLDLVKGRGAAHAREKVVAAQAERFVVLADPTKRVDRLGATKAVPVEVLPMAVAPVSRRLEELGAAPTLRTGEAKDGPVVTDQGLWILDARFDAGIDDPHAVDAALNACPGVLDHGLFLDLATRVLVGHPDGGVDVLRR